MDGKIDVYCDWGFLKNFYESCPGGVNQKALLKNWSLFDEILSKKSHLFTIDLIDDISSEDNIDDATKILYEYYAEGKIRPLPEEKNTMAKKIEDDDGKDYFRDKENAIFLFNRRVDECAKLECDYGLIFMSSEEDYLNRFSFLFSPQRYLINSESSVWASLKQVKHPCNYAIISDGYLFESKDTLEETIIEILDSIMPKQLNKSEFSLQINSKKSDKGGETTDNSRRQNIERIVKNIESNYPYKISLRVNLEKRDHDRYLLTNYCIIECGYGFNLSNSQRKTGTSLHFTPFTSGSNAEALKKK
jgi:hypothetical protein